MALEWASLGAEGCSSGTSSVIVCTGCAKLGIGGVPSPDHPALVGTCECGTLEKPLVVRVVMLAEVVFSSSIFLIFVND